MAELSDPLDVRLPRALHVQIADRYRRAMDDGDLGPGAKLPSNQLLARQWGVNVNTVQRAMVMLVRENRISRVPHRGTFVRERTERLGRIGVYYRAAHGVVTEPHYLRALHAQLQDLMWKEELEMRIMADPRSRDEQRRPWPELMEAIQRRTIQGLIVTVTDSDHLWLRRLPVPLAIQGSCELPNAVQGDMDHMARLGVERLAKQGSQRVGLITAHGRQREHGLWSYPQELIRHARKKGLEARASWQMFCGGSMNGLEDQERYGFQAMHQLWSQPDRPDGLVVYPDSVAGGVLKAVLKLGIDVPGTLKLAVHRNVGVGLFSPVPVDFLDFDPRDVAKALL
ncbi:MAG: GntR family transcriptional regulator, partial [Phycisphaeraceae bacterium]|nr:GntR family transcriptional regulator [Phycisphaeraceae bacterium]